MNHNKQLTEYLDECIYAFYADFLSLHQFVITKKYSDALGAMYEFTNQDFNLCFTNDRGVLSTEVASLYQPDSFLNIESLNTFIQLKENQPKGLSQWELKMMRAKRLSCKEMSEFLSTHHQTLAIWLNKENYVETIREIRSTFK